MSPLRHKVKEVEKIELKNEKKNGKTFEK